MVDGGREFVVKFKIMMANIYGKLFSPISTRNPLANSIEGRAHQAIGHIICTYKIQEMDLDNESPWEGIL